MKIEIDVFKSDKKRKDKLTKKEMVQIASVCLKVCQLKRDIIFLNVTFCSKRAMLKLNKSTRQEHHATNVLSFEAKTDQVSLNNLVKNGMVCDKYKMVYLGEMVLCPEVVKEEAEKLGIPMKERYYLLFTHGLCHLLGYDHRTKQEEKQMIDIEEKTLLHFDIKDPYWYNCYDTEDVD